jgi:hypothetical protein
LGDTEATVLRAPVPARASPCILTGGAAASLGRGSQAAAAAAAAAAASLRGGSQAAAAAAASLGWSQAAAAAAAMVDPKPAPLDPRYFSEEGSDAQAEKPTLKQAAPLTAEEAVAQAAAEGLKLMRSSSNTSGYLGVWVDDSSRSTIYR